MKRDKAYIHLICHKCHANILPADIMYHQNGYYYCDNCGKVLDGCQNELDKMHEFLAKY